MRSAAAAALAMALATLFLMSSGQAARGSSNLLIDDGFESGVGDWGARGATLDTTCAFAYEGACSAVLSSDTDADVKHPLVPIQASADYTFSAFVFKNDPAVRSVELQLLWRDQAGRPISSSGTFPPLTGDETNWQHLSLDATAPPDAAFAWPWISVVFNGSGTVYFDDVTLEGPPPLTPTDTPPPTETPPAIDTPAIPVSPQPSAATATIAPAATATKEGSATPTTVPSTTPTTGPSDSLVNGGFEDSDGSGPIGWAKYGGDLQRSSAHARSGQYSGAFSSDTTSTKWAYQTLLVSGGSGYTFSGYVLLNDPAVSEAFLRISWYGSDDGSGTALATSDSTAHLSGPDPSFRFLSTDAVLAPADSRSARLRVVLAPASDALATIYIDDVSFEPASPPAAETPPPPILSVDEPPQSDIGVPALIQRVTKPRATVAGQSVVRQATPPATQSPRVVNAATQRQQATGVGAAVSAPVPTSADTRLRLLISLASGAVALLIGGSSGLFLARLNGRRL
ncbi:MAG: hypothetical protein ABSC13_09120 [Dehalococcoidia bacterium]